MEDPSSLLVDSNSPWQIPYSPLISEEPDKVSPGRRQDSNFTKFTSLLDTSLFDEEGIRYTLPDHVYAEESSSW